MGLPDTQMEALIESEYVQGFVTQIDSDTLPPGLDEEVIRTISARKGEPEWMLDRRLTAYRHWLTMSEPDWASVRHPPIDFQAISYYSSPKKKPGLDSLDQVDPELLETYEKLGIPLEEQKALAGVAVDAVFDSVSV
ncbi:MAG: Fe-S cluster assembly protein SufB, partial [Chromatiales bacterium]